MNPLYSFILIDDEPISNQLTEIQIKRVFDNATIDGFNDAKEALTTIEQDYNDFANGTIIFLDINMPYPGWDFLTAFGNMPANITGRFKIYLLTALAEEEDMARAKNYPMVLGQLEKPLTKDLLLDLARK